MDRNYANYLIQKTKDDYNRIAVKFSNTRTNLSNDIVYLRKFVQPQNKILDFGCGNGRLSGLFTDKSIQYTGVDFSSNLIKIAQKQYPKGRFILINNFKLPFPDNYFDAVYCLSVLHHIPSQPYRLKLLEEFKRILKSRGKLVLTVWNLINEPSVKWQIIKNAIIKIFGLTKLDFKDFFRSFGDGKQTVRRYLHYFTRAELAKLFIQTGFNTIEQKVIYRGKSKKYSNLLIVATK